MAHLECESQLSFITFRLFTTVFNKEMFHFKEAVKETISNKIII